MTIRGVFRAMDGFPVTIRLLDPPLHEFLPRREELMVEIAKLRTHRRQSHPKLKELRTVLRRVEEAARDQIPCSDTAVAAWASRIRKYRRCRRAPSSKLPVDVAKDGVKVIPKS